MLIIMLLFLSHLCVMVYKLFWIFKNPMEIKNIIDEIKRYEQSFQLLFIPSGHFHSYSTVFWEVLVKRLFYHKQNL